MNTEKDVFVKKFMKHFYSKQNKKIVLYGTGIITRYIIEDCSDRYNIVSIMDTNYPKSDFLGKQVVKTISKLDADLLIIMNRDPIITQVIAERIKSLVFDIPVYDLNGKKIRQTLNIKFDNNDSISYEDLISEIDRHDVISFDIFDTLITRTVSSPSDVFSIIENKYDTKVKGFLLKRQRAAEMAMRKNGYPTIYNIYDELCKLMGGGLINELLEYELFVEKCVLIRREKVVQLLHYALSKDKEVYFISDMYLPKKILKDFLKNLNIYDSKIKILVSCDEKASKADMSLWKMYRKVIHGKSALHIGDDEISDFLLPNQFGIDAIKINSPIASYKKFITDVPYPTFLHDKIALGIIITKIFNNPFLKDVDDFDSYGYILAPVLVNYILWIIRNVKLKDFSKVYFFARDGFFLQKLFDNLMIKLGQNIKSYYLMISRSFITYLQCLKADGSLEEINFQGTYRDLLYYRYNILLDDNDVDADKFVDTSVESVNILLRNYISVITEEVSLQRKLYTEYLMNLAFFNSQENVIVDPSYNGTTQYYLEKLTGVKLKGYYCYCNTSVNNQYYNAGDENMVSLYHQKNVEDDSYLFKYNIFFEASIMVAPHGSLLKLTNDSFALTPIGNTQKKFDNKIATFDGVLSFTDRYFSISHLAGIDLLSNSEYSAFEASLLTSIYRNMLLSAKIKQSIYMDSYFTSVFDIPVY